MLRPLNTADHFTLMMDHEIRQSGLAGNFCALVFKLASHPDAEILSSRANAFVARFPETNVRLIQKGRRYFWQSNRDRKPSLFFHHTAETSEAGLDLIGDIINTATPATAAAPVAFHLIDMPGHSYFLLRWFHPICDAKGAELIVHHLLGDENKAEGEDAFAQLTAKWGVWKKIGMMYRAKRHIDSMDTISSSLPRTTAVVADRLKFHVMHFDNDTSKQIMARSMKEAGMMGTALYFIGCLMRALDRVGCDEGQGFCVPYAMNMRKRKALFPLLGNQVSFLFAQANLQQVRDRKQLFTSLREQYKATVRSGLDHALVPLMEAGSWLPLEKYGRIIRNTPKGRERSSFWFSYTGEPDPKLTEIAGAQVTSMFQLSQVTAAPSLGMLVSQYNGAITLSFNYVASQIAPEWLDALTKEMAAQLKGEETA
ncbi:MAG: hypothetical protein AUJ57_03230 [Zetaproteobacteria bacterium CG1_02_53_45]|nr:MAG: hypothetical protein AUJ57_03230 [Zetaproteobacteria bacterium CG1_02_53_45]